MNIRSLRRAVRLTMIAGGWCTVALLPQVALASGADTVRSFYGVLLNTMRNGPALGHVGRYTQLASAIVQDFNINRMTQLAMGPEWSSLNSAQQAQVVEAFARYIAAVYADRFDSYSGEQLQVLGERPTAAGVIVQTRIIQSDGKPVDISYLMVDNGGAWQICDVYLDGTISQLATQRSEFSSILRDRGVTGLLAALNNKAYMLVPPRS
jgi:phospholipid transport system substrate-binding protein